MEIIENFTCVRFVKYSNQQNFVFLTGGDDACISKIGMRGGRQEMQLLKSNGVGCFTTGKILHEFIHLLGEIA
jgi:Astacin (Peptidase family M12A)